MLVVGTGFKPPLRGLAGLLREMVEGLDTPMVAVDLPSGVGCEIRWSRPLMDRFRADSVVTFTAPKRAHMFGHLTRNEKTGGTFGPVVVAGDRVAGGRRVVSAGGLTWTGRVEGAGGEGSRRELAQGQVWACAGDWGELRKGWGGRRMASLACLRTGAGLVTAAVPKSILDTVAGDYA